MNENIKYYYLYQTPIGKIIIEQEAEAISKIQLQSMEIFTSTSIFKETALIKNAYNQLKEYFEGNRRVFDLPLALHGTEFQNKVWVELMKIPYGKTCSYLDIAKAVQIPKGARAVGMANNKNDIIIVIPCHRVIGANGKLIGYAGGLSVKKYLLDLESKNM